MQAGLGQFHGLETVNAGAGKPRQVKIAYSEKEDIPLGMAVFFVPKDLERLGINPWQEETIEVKVDEEGIHLNGKTFSLDNDSCHDGKL